MNSRLLDDFSLETTARAAGGLAAVQGLIPAGTRVAVPFLDGDDLRAVTASARTVRDLGFRPVPHLAARRLPSAAELADELDALRDVTDEVFLVGGDPTVARGPFPDALAVIRSGALAGHGLHHVGLPAYPGHDGRPGELLEKAGLLREQGLDTSAVTQFAAAGTVLTWLGRARADGLWLPVRVGVAGAAGIPPRLAARLGVARHPGGPEGLLDELAGGHDPDRHGELKLHFAPFHAVRETAEWLAAQRAAAVGPAYRR